MSLEIVVIFIESLRMDSFSLVPLCRKNQCERKEKERFWVHEAVENFTEKVGRKGEIGLGSSRFYETAM